MRRGLSRDRGSGGCYCRVGRSQKSWELKSGRLSEGQMGGNEEEEEGEAGTARMSDLGLM